MSVIDLSQSSASRNATPEPDQRAIASKGLGILGEVPWAVKSRSVALWQAYRIVLAARQFYAQAAARTPDSESRKRWERASKNADECAEGLETWFKPALQRMASEAMRLGTERFLDLASEREQAEREQTERDGTPT